MSLMDASGPGSFGVLAAGLRELIDRLPGDVSLRRVAQVAGVPLSSAAAWLAAERFPQQIDGVLRLVRAVGGIAGAGGIIGEDGRVAGLLDEQRWRLAYRAEAQRRAAVMSDAVRGAQARAVLMPGWPLARVTNPFALEVHRPVQPDHRSEGLAELPEYVSRAHDTALAAVVRAAAAGSSGIAVLVGGSSTGKTRACWQALELLRGQEPGWRLWHPIDPSRPVAALREVHAIAPRTVVWLNEAQFYLATTDSTGEQIAAGLRELLRDPGRGPVLVLATLWPQFWDLLTSRPQGDQDQHAQARELLAGHALTVPATFTPAQLQSLTRAEDPRLAQAAAQAQDGQVIQYLAGAPELLARYHNAPPGAKAVIEAAMDARRLGMRPALPLGFLAAAAPGYLASADWDQAAEDWLEQALAYTTRPGKGARGPVTRIRAFPCGGPPGSEASGPLYQLADYLDQAGRRDRGEEIPPATFWAAAASAHPSEQAALGDVAYDRGLYQHAAQLHKNATTAGSQQAAISLIRHLRRSHPGDPRPARHATAHANLQDPSAVASLLQELRKPGAHEQVQALLARDPAGHADLQDPSAVASLLRELWKARADEQVQALLARDPAGHVNLQDPSGIASLLRELRKPGAYEQVRALLARDPAGHADLQDPSAMASLLRELRDSGAHDQARALLARAAADVNLHDPSAMVLLLQELWESGAHDQARDLLARAAADVNLHDPSAMVLLLRELWESGAHGQAQALATRAIAHANLQDPSGMASLLHELWVSGAHDQAQALASRAAAYGNLRDPYGMARLLEELWKTGAHDQAQTLLARDPAAHADLQDPSGIASLLQELRKAGAHDQAQALLARDPAAHVNLQDPSVVVSLLKELRASGAHDQAQALAARAAAHANLGNPYAVASLLKELRDCGAHHQVEAIANRLPAAGKFSLYCQQKEGRTERLRFGCSTARSSPAVHPAPPWHWEDLA